MKTMSQPALTDIGKLAGRLLMDGMWCTGMILQRVARGPHAEREDEKRHGERRAEHEDEYRHERHDEHRRRHCGCGCCEIPETECPPRCTGPIEVGAMTGQTVTAVITVVNRASTPRNFTFSATPFQYGTTSASFAFAPPALSVAAGASGFTVASLTIPVSFAKGEYQGEIIVLGAYEQCVRVELEVGCEETRSAHAEVVQLEAPFRIRAHRWFHHFQCVEPCAQIDRGPAGVPGASPAGTKG